MSSAPERCIEQVFAGCNEYFMHRPYSWFNPLEKMLQQANASYFDGSACHLDFVQWATSPVWNKLAQSDRERLLEDDVPFLQQQLVQEGLGLLLLNGAQIIKTIRKRLEIDLQPRAESQGRVRLFTGRAATGLLLIGWNINLQSSFGVTKTELEYIRRTVGSVFRQMKGGVGADATHPTIPQIDALLKHLPALRDPVGGRENSIGINELMAALYKSGFVVNFDWPSWQPTAEAYVVGSEDLRSATIETLQKLLTTHVRKERFCEDHFNAMIRCGHIRAIIERLAELRLNPNP